MHCHRTNRLFEDQRIPIVSALVIAFVVVTIGCVSTQNILAVIE